MIKRARSSITGRFVSAAKAFADPSTTQVEARNSMAHRIYEQGYREGRADLKAELLQRFEGEGITQYGTIRHTIGQS